jgi:hypothetical protein
MISSIKFVILTFLAMLGIKNFNEEILIDIVKNPLGYATSLSVGLITSSKLVVTPVAQSFSSEILKSLIAITTAVLIVVCTFIVNKIMLPIWEQKLKNKIYKFFKLEIIEGN